MPVLNYMDGAALSISCPPITWAILRHNQMMSVIFLVQCYGRLNFLLGVTSVLMLSSQGIPIFFPMKRIEFTLDDGTKENQIPKLPTSHFPTSTKPKLLKAKDLDAQNHNSAELTAKPKPKANPSAKRKREPDPAPASDIEDDGQRPKHTRRSSDKVIKNKQVAEEKRLEAEEMKRKRETSGSQSGRKHGQKRNSCIIIVLLRCKPGSSVTFKFVDCDRRHHL
ncbi:hypothetical protein C8J56DRAFT_906388 [Mycena floridula]|nr:hypothetical protein C8J56DRAFT_906388 [Mycena floridula]